MTAFADVDIVVPILNEVTCVDELIDRLERTCPGAHLIFVDNGSTDGTLERLSSRNVTTIRHERNEGYGKSLRDGIDAGTGRVIITIDADLEYPPESATELLQALESSPVVYGSRFLGQRPDMSVTRRLGNQLLTSLFNIVCRQNLTDLYTGVKAFRREVVAGHPFSETGFVFVVEFAARVSKLCRIGDIPVNYRPRVRGQSKMRHLAEGFRALVVLLRHA